MLCIISVSLVCLDYFAKYWLARPYPMMRGVHLHQYQLHEGPLTFKQSSSYGLFLRFLYSFSYCYFLVVHLHHDHLVTTFEFSHILTN